MGRERDELSARDDWYRRIGCERTEGMGWDGARVEGSGLGRDSLDMGPMRVVWE